MRKLFSFSGRLWRSRLGRRFLAALLATLTISSLVFLVLLVYLYQGRLVHEHARASLQISGALRASLENAMLKRDLPGLQSIVSDLGRQEDIVSVTILHPKGEIRFSSQENMVGRQFPGFNDGKGIDLAEPSSQFLRQEGGDVVRSFNPVPNREPCKPCHGPAAENPVNGILVVDYRAGEVRGEALAAAVGTMASGFVVICLSLVAVGLVLYSLVLRPVWSLSEIADRFARGDLAARFANKGKDELSVLGARFNTMAEELERKIVQLRSSESFLQSVIDAVPDGVRVIGTDYRILKVNDAYCRQLGIGPEEAIGQPCHLSSHKRKEPCSATMVPCPLIEFQSGNSRLLKCQHRHIDGHGKEFFVEVSAARATLDLDGERQVCVIESIRDLADQVKLSHEQRLAEVGQLAAGIAHEIDNPLSSIQLALAALTNEYAKGGSKDAMDEYLGIVEREIENCRYITGKLLRLSEPSGNDMMLLSIRDAAQDVASLLKFEAEKNGVEFVVDVDPGLRVVAGSSDLGMMIFNLVQNALHAMPKGGMMTLRARADGTGIVFDFIDTGVGIPAGDIKKIFWPFWSKRADASRGTGLGLSICKALLDQLNGTISVKSKVGQGTCISVRLPNPDAQS